MHELLFLTLLSGDIFKHNLHGWLTFPNNCVVIDIEKSMDTIQADIILNHITGTPTAHPT
ncbi:hypothetical protein OK016_01535 [Vibrio chagasii]|nr:hypothetical protein [Vibrio chagasii]